SFVNGEIQCGESNEKPSNSSKCTPNAETRVIGGKCANPGQFPWVAIINLSSGNRFCGGAILDKYTIMTAARCTFSCPRIGPGIPVKKYKITIGERNLNKANDGQMKYTTTTAIVHEDYLACSASFANDIALLKIGGNGM
ncbi:hypothetical protein B4U80_12112, partial [Leptotrombidium deliense]